ncbi:hypothetical protein ADIMK_3277 [Marinobacterium lacunae]|uniref:Uncharacterized protein n=1 Tax=Marinobacterium lacunae TaxID=1232683 RepID=A0A081FWA0_9GAMM|nr:hypothetical protein [Marinobacterium lacunae]KEA62805.1 hypothetical protein ADIMK_3277 [Marinobacterium lacunae]MBR9883834.1 hypothetical protein [Oceanospirillales bacterium]
MKWLIIVFVIMSLIGSVMWVMPTPRQRFQAHLRLKARTLGLQVQLVTLKLPRMTGEMEGESISVPAYRLLRTNLSRAQKESWCSWQVCRGETLANTGLGQGWSWITGEGLLPGTVLEHVNAVLERLPDDVVALESTPIHMTAFWHESDEATLERLAGILKELVEVRV